MTVFRKILKVETKGSRATADLKPILSDHLPRGVNLVVHEYNEPEGWCIAEIFGSDHPFVNERISSDDLNRLAEHPSVIETLATHPKSPEVITHIYFHPEIHASPERYSIDEERKRIVDKETGKEASYIRVELDDRGRERILIDEG